jgi:hypothetical protein
MAQIYSLKTSESLSGGASQELLMKTSIRELKYYNKEGPRRYLISVMILMATGMSEAETM